MMGLNDDLPDAYLFNIEMVPRWSEPMIPILSLGKWDKATPENKNKRLIETSSSYQLIAGQLYRLGNDGVLRLAIDQLEISQYLTEAHILVGGFHSSKDQTLKRLQRQGVYWPMMKSDVHTFVKECYVCQIDPPTPHATLFKVTVAPKWSYYIVEYSYS